MLPLSVAYKAIHFTSRSKNIIYSILSKSQCYNSAMLFQMQRIKNILFTLYHLVNFAFYHFVSSFYLSNQNVIKKKSKKSLWCSWNYTRFAIYLQNFINYVRENALILSGLIIIIWHSKGCLKSYSINPFHVLSCLRCDTLQADGDMSAVCVCCIPWPITHGFCRRTGKRSRHLPCCHQACAKWEARLALLLFLSSAPSVIYSPWLCDRK